MAVDRSETMDECLAALRALRRLATLAVTVASFVLDDRHMAALGALPLADLRLVSQARLDFVAAPVAASMPGWSAVHLQLLSAAAGCGWLQPRPPDVRAKALLSEWHARP